MHIFLKGCFCFRRNAKEEKSFVEGGKTLNLPGGVQNESENNTRFAANASKEITTLRKQRKTILTVLN